eukprot:3721643-Pyramimonas_sp.AAC.1
MSMPSRPGLRAATPRARGPVDTGSRGTSRTEPPCRPWGRGPAEPRPHGLWTWTRSPRRRAQWGRAEGGGPSQKAQKASTL